MNTKKILIIALLLLIIASMTIDATYAVSREKIEIHKKAISAKNINTFNKEIVTVEEISTTKNNILVAYKININIKKGYKSKFKIDSVRCTYTDYENYHSETIYKTYDGKNKISLTIKPPKNWSLEHMTDYVNFSGLNIFFITLSFFYNTFIDFCSSWYFLFL
jgi:uncharacterized protein